MVVLVVDLVILVVVLRETNYWVVDGEAEDD